MSHETTRATTGASAAVPVVWRVTAISPNPANPQQALHQAIDRTFDSHAQAQAASDVFMAYNPSVVEVRICRVEVPA